jgi:hypothetical protein
MSEENWSAQSQILLYQTEDGRQRIEVRLEQGTVWLSQVLMAELFQTTVANINLHIKNIYEEKEVPAEGTIKQYLIVRQEGSRKVRRLVIYYNLDTIFAVGFRVRSHRGVQFRQWAIQLLKEYVVKGFTLDDERLSSPGGIAYFDELLDRIRSIRASEKHFYQKIRDIYTLSADYDPQHAMTQEFFKTVQNKLLYAVTGCTAAEIIHKRVNAAQPNLGLMTWDGAPRGKRLTKRDVEIAKNYLNHDEIKNLEQLVSQYLDFAERQARHHKVMYMADWKTKLDAFLQVNDEKILTHAGSISAEIAKELALAEYEKFDEHRRREELVQSEDELREAIQKVITNRKASNSHETT